jgi:hypothetical protein
MYHTPQSIKRYISTFLRMVVLHRKGLSVAEIAFLTKSSERLVEDYLALYMAALQSAPRLEKLAEELKRVDGLQVPQKKERVRP